ncbi:MAG: hypothetical protein ACRELB_08580, partial [Polyangiaceae bacterium]
GDAMQVFCPRCAAPNDVASSATSAQCTSCGAALPVHMPGYGPPDAGSRPHTFGLDDMAAVPRVVLPKVNFVWNERQLPGGAWGVYVGGRSGAGVMWVVFAIGSVVATSMVCANVEGDPVVPIVLSGVVSLFFAYRALCWAVNRGIVRVDQDWLAMYRGPLWQPGRVRVATASIATMRPYKTGTLKGGATVTVYFGVQAVGGDGTTTALPFSWMPREQAAYVCERLNTMVREVQKRAGIVAPQLPMPGQF